MNKIYVYILILALYGCAGNGLLPESRYSSEVKVIPSGYSIRIIADTTERNHDGEFLSNELVKRCNNRAANLCGEIFEGEPQINISADVSHNTGTKTFLYAKGIAKCG